MELTPIGGTSPTLRESNVGRLERAEFDVLVIGGGINGAVSAAALAASGASVALVDAADFASFTSQHSSNLVWGGIKYLENFELSLVRKLCNSRNELIRAFPSNIAEVRFYVPLEKKPMGLLRNQPALWAGTWIYWLFGNCFTRKPRWLSAQRVVREEPCLEPEMVRGGVEYSDAYLLDCDARFTFGFVRNALNHGAAVANYVGVRDCERGADGMWTARVFDRVANRDFSIRAQTLVNAAGPYVDSLNERNSIRTDTHHLFSKGIHVVVDRIATRDHVLTFFDETQRMFFVIPMGHRSVIGTTDTRVPRPESHVTDEDRAFLFENVNRRLKLDRPLGPEDIIAERCGVRPLVVEGSADDDQSEWLNLSRKHVIDLDSDKKCLSIFGGKLTDCLNIGKEVVEGIEDFGIEVQRPTERWYGEPGRAIRSEFLREALRVRLDRRPDEPTYERLSTRLWRRYGTNAFAMIEEIGRDPRLGETVIEGTQYRRCELGFAARSEMIVRLEDFLRRRSKIALVRRHEDLAAAEGLREACEMLFGADGPARYDEYFEAS